METIPQKTPPGASMITLVNPGPIERLEIPVNENGGVVVLRGPNGSGKSTAIAGVHALAGGKDAVPVRDGALEATIVGLGARLTVAKRTTRAGVLSVETLDSDLDPGLLIDPGIKDPEAADMERARVLCALAGVEPDLSYFSDLAGEPDGDVVEQIASPKAIEAKSLPEMAKWLKRDFEVIARKQEDAARQAAQLAAGYALSIEGVDLSGESDEMLLAAETEDAIRDLAAVEQMATAATRAIATRESIREKVQALRATHEEGAVEKALALKEQALLGVTIAREEVAAAGERIDAALRELDAAKAQGETRAAGLRVANGAAENAIAALAKAEATEKDIAALEAELATGTLSGLTVPSDAVIAAARASVDAKRQAQERGVTVRRGKTVEAKVKELEQDARLTGEIAARWRVSCDRVWGVVGEAVSAVAPQGLTFEDGRIYVTTADRGRELFAELSDGERASIALAACVDACATGGLLTMPQRVWEGLDPAHRAEAHALARLKRVTILTAEASDGELRAEAFDPLGE